jgi:hypothetical protein
LFVCFVFEAFLKLSSHKKTCFYSLFVCVVIGTSLNLYSHKKIVINSVSEL